MNVLSRESAGRIYQSVLERLPDYLAVNLMYLISFRRLPHLRNPRTFNEKIAWRKLYQRDPRLSVFADKIAVKAEVAKLIGQQHVIETLWTGGNPEDIPFGTLHPPYVIKVNHSCGANIFIRRAEDVKKPEILAFLRKQLGTSYGRKWREWGYLSIPPRVLVERMVQTPGEEVPEDYKFFTYHGRVHFIQFDRDRFSGHRLSFYDPQWNCLPVKLRSYSPVLGSVSKPANLAAMIELAERIGAQFDFVRVDLYSPPPVFFGEASFYPNSGLQAFVPERWDYEFGKPWKH